MEETVKDPNPNTLYLIKYRIFANKNAAEIAYYTVPDEGYAKYFAFEKKKDGRLLLALTENSRQELDERHSSLADYILVEPNDIESHPNIEEVKITEK